MSHRTKTSKKKYVALGTAGLVLVGAGAAYAYFSSTGSGTGSSTSGTSSPFQIAVASTNLADLTPGGPTKTVNFTVTNTGTGVQRLSAIAANVTSTSDAGCTAADFAVGSASIAYGDMAGGSSVPGTFTLQMINRNGVNQDACKGVTVNLNVATALQLSIVQGTGLNSPWGLTADPAGNVYVADSQNQVVKKITPGGTVTTVAGNGQQGNNSTGVATTSQLNLPYGLALDSAGNLYISNLLGNRIQKVTPAGAISVFAGTGTPGMSSNGPATSSNLNQPAHLAVDASDNLYIADQLNNRVEKVTPAGALTVVAGTGGAGAMTPGSALASQLNHPQGVGVDPSGNIFIADTGNQRIEKVTAAGVISSYAGNGTNGATLTGVATTSQLGNPSDAQVDASGNLYISNTGANNVLLVTPAGALSKVAGNQSATTSVAGPALSTGVNGPHQMAIGLDGNIYITLQGSNQVIKLSF